MMNDLAQMQGERNHRKLVTLLKTTLDTDEEAIDTIEWRAGTGVGEKEPGSYGGYRIDPAHDPIIIVDDLIKRYSQMKTKLNLIITILLAIIVSVVYLTHLPTTALEDKSAENKGLIEEEILDSGGNEIGLKVRIEYPTHLQVDEKGDIIVELLTKDARNAGTPDHQHNILEGVIKIGSDESLHKEGKADLWIDPTKGGTLEPYNTYCLYYNLVSIDKTPLTIIDGEVQILKTLPGSGTLIGAYDTLNWISSKLEDAANYDIGTLPSSKIFKNENDYDVWIYGWTFNYYKTECVSGNRVKLVLPFSFEKEGERPIVIYITTKFEKTDPIIVPFYEPLKIAYESDEFNIIVGDNALPIIIPVDLCMVLDKSESMSESMKNSNYSAHHGHKTHFHPGCTHNQGSVKEAAEGGT